MSSISISGSNLQPAAFSGTGAADSKTLAASKTPSTTSILNSASLVSTGIAKSTGASTEGLKSPDTSKADAAAQASLIAGLSSATANVGSDTAAIAALMQKIAQEQRNTAREVRTTEIVAQVTQLKSAADEMRTAADQRFTTAVTSVGIGIGATALATGAGIGGLGSVASSKSQMSTEQGAKTLAADAVKAEVSVKAMGSNVQPANEMAQQMTSVIQDVRDKLASIQQSQIEANRSIVRNI